MQRLISVIGPAPSEMPREDLMVKLQRERARVRRCLDIFRNQQSLALAPKPRKKRITKAAIFKVEMAQLEDAGLTLEDLRRYKETLKGAPSDETD